MVTSNQSNAYKTLMLTHTLSKAAEKVTSWKRSSKNRGKEVTGVEKWAEDKGSGKASVLAAVIWSNYI